MSGNISGERLSYRRGLVLGFTVAEVLLLILFAILLALGSILAKKRLETEAYETKQASLQQELDLATPQLQALAELKMAMPPVIGSLSADEFWRELVRITDERDQAQRALVQADEVQADLQNTLNEFKEIEQIVAEAANGEAGAKALQSAAAKAQALERVFSEDTPFSDVEPLLELAKTLDQLLPPAGDPARAEAEANILNASHIAQQLRNQLAGLEKSNTTLEGRLANATRSLLEQGKDLPACWARQDGNSEYIFDVALQPDGIVVYDNALPQWRNEQAELSISSRLFDRPVSQSEFTDMTQRLFRHSQQMDCRFFVRVYDMTGPTEKLLYKALLETVEGHFYKFLASDNRNWPGAKYVPPDPEVPPAASLAEPDSESDAEAVEEE